MQRAREFRPCAGCGSATLVQFLNLARGGLCKACEARQLAQEDVGESHIDQIRDERETRWNEDALSSMGLGKGYDDLPDAKKFETRIVKRKPLTVGQFAALKKLGYSADEIRGLSVAEASRLMQRGPKWRQP
jgi:hypothetical protein